MVSRLASFCALAACMQIIVFLCSCCVAERSLTASSCALAACMKIVVLWCKCCVAKRMERPGTRIGKLYDFKIKLRFSA